MSDLPPQAAPGDGPSEEEVRAYLGQMRQAPVEQVVAEVLQGLLSAAQVKLGRRDARLLLDTAASITAHTGPHLSGDLRQQVDDALSQLRMAQVEAEKEVAASPDPEANDLDAAPTPPADPDSSGQPPAQQPAPAPGAAASKLWVPGR